MAVLEKDDALPNLISRRDADTHALVVARNPVDFAVVDDLPGASEALQQRHGRRRSAEEKHAG